MVRLTMVAVLGTALFAASPAEKVLAAQRAWLESYNHRDADAPTRIEADDFRVVFGDGTVQNK